MSDLIQKHEQIQQRVRVLEVVQAKLQVNVWLTKFILGTLVTLSLVVGGGMYGLSRQVSEVREEQRATDVKLTWFITTYMRGNNGSEQYPQLGSSGGWLGWDPAPGSEVLFCRPSAPESRTYFPPGAGWAGLGGRPQGH